MGPPPSDDEQQSPLLPRVMMLENAVNTLRAEQVASARQSEINIRIDGLKADILRNEQEIQQLKKEKANEESIRRLEQNQAEAKSGLNDIKKLQNDQALDLQKLQISVLRYIVVTIIGFVVSIAIAVILLIISRVF